MRYIILVLISIGNPHSGSRLGGYLPIWNLKKGPFETSDHLCLTIGGFPIEIETQISKLSYFYFIKIAKLYVISLLILVSILIGNPPYISPNYIELFHFSKWPIDPKNGEPLGCRIKIVI